VELWEQINTLVILATSRLAESGARMHDARAVQEALSCIADIVAGRAELLATEPPVVRYVDGRIVMFDGEDVGGSRSGHPR
jgi:hypothetical protein